MSRIGNAIINIPDGVEVNVSSDNIVTVKGTKGELTQQIDLCLEVAVAEGVVTVSRKTEEKDHKAKHGLYRSLIFNMVVGVTEGYKTEQELVGVGYKATNNGQKLEMLLGYSHNIIMEMPEEIKLTTETVKGKPPRITLESMDKQLVGQVAAKIRSLRKPEPYKGKGIRFVGEQVRRKAGKTVAK
ncbi:MAG: 50S ribosomal protein L6 [Flavobacteriales bacterium]|nr:50S ribosomal protein L6 [Flavobacteriales bacterium]